MATLLRTAAVRLYFAVGILWLALAGAAQAEPGEAGQFVRGLADDAIAVLSDENLTGEAREQAFRDLLRRGFDAPAVGRFVLGRYWNTADEGEREEFLQAFEDYVIATYARRLGRYGGEQLVIAGERPESNCNAIVVSRIELPDGPPIRVDWRLHQRDGSWRIIDIVVEQVSLLIAQRSEFASVIRANRGDVSALSKLLRQKVTQLAARS